jgi:hypothetical protein
MDSFTSLEILSTAETLVVSQSATSSPSYEPSSDGIPVDEERYNSGSSVAFCVVA